MKREQRWEIFGFKEAFCVSEKASHFLPNICLPFLDGPHAKCETRQIGIITGCDGRGMKAWEKDGQSRNNSFLRLFPSLPLFFKYAVACNLSLWNHSLTVETVELILRPWAQWGDCVSTVILLLWSGAWSFFSLKSSLSLCVSPLHGSKAALIYFFLTTNMFVLASAGLALSSLQKLINVNIAFVAVQCSIYCSLWRLQQKKPKNLLLRKLEIAARKVWLNCTCMVSFESF